MFPADYTERHTRVGDMAGSLSRKREAEGHFQHLLLSCQVSIVLLKVP